MNNVFVDEIQVAAITASGDQSFSIAGFGTPKAAIFTVTKGVVNSTITDHAKISYGFTDGINQGVLGGRSRDGLSGASQTSTIGSSGCVIAIINTVTDTVEARAVFKEWTASGAILTWDAAPSEAYLITCQFLNGSDVSAYVGGYQHTGPLNSSVTVTGVGFKPDTIIHESMLNNPFDGTVNARLEMNIGYSTRNPADNTSAFQGSVNFASVDNAANGTINVLASSGYVWQSFAGTSKLQAGDVTSYNSDGFVIAERESGGTQEARFLALAFNGAVDYAAWSFDVPTSDGSSTDGGPGFKPQWASYLMSRALVRDVVDESGDIGVFGISSFTDAQAHSNVIMDADGSVTSDTKSISDANPVFFPDQDGANEISALFGSMEDTGPRLSWANTSSAFNWVGLAIGENPGAVLASGSCNLYTVGPPTGVASGNHNLFINGAVAIPAVVCPPLDATASIQIKPALIAIYQSRIDALINQLGKNVRLIFDSVLTPCPNCLYDVMRKRSNGIYRTGGPRPFKRGRKCPYCKGKGLNETAVEKCIKCLLKWNPEDAKNYGISIAGRKGVVRMKTFLTSADDIIQAKTAISNYDIKSQMNLKVKLISGPIPVGLREDRYCISFWELL